MNLHARNASIFGVLGRKNPGEAEQRNRGGQDMRGRSPVKSMDRRSRVVEEAAEVVGGTKLRKIFAILVLIFIFLSPSTKGLSYEKKDFGLAKILGSPTGFSAKLWVSKR